MGSLKWSQTESEGVVRVERIDMALKRKRKATRPKSVDVPKAHRRSSAKSGFFGVGGTQQGRFLATPLKGVSAGTWTKVEDAAIARDRVILFLGLERPLNFPEKARALGPASAADMMREARAMCGADQSSRYLGVSFDARRKGWCANMYVEGKHRHLGRFANELEAARAYDQAMWNLYADPDRLNFPPPKRRPTGEAPASRATPKRSRFLGVSLNVKGKYAVQVTHEGRMHTVGMFATEEEAAEARDRLLLHLGLPHEALNFPDRKLVPASIEQLRDEARLAFKQQKTSLYRGVSYSTSKRCWVASITSGYRVRGLGSYDSEIDAAHAYDRAALRLHEKPKLNFLGDITNTRKRK